MSQHEEHEEERRPIEMWAEQKGLAPQFLAAGSAKQNPDYWKFAAAKAFKGWSAAEQVTERDFDAAVKEVQTHEHR